MAGRLSNIAEFPIPQISLFFAFVLENCTVLILSAGYTLGLLGFLGETEVFLILSDGLWDIAGSSHSKT